jgi:putative Holliday junction resolvase
MGGESQRRGCALGLDYGSRRIGLAVSDPEGLIAFPAGALERTGLERDLAALTALIAERGVTRVVVGLPLHLSGRSGPEAEAARAFARALGQAAGLPVDLLDERWTTREAERALRDAGEPSSSSKRSAQRGGAERSAGGAGRSRAGPRQAGRKRSRGSVDCVAATLLLRTYLERERGAEGGSSG